MLPARIITYYSNAYVDAALAGELVSLITTGKSQHQDLEVQRRAVIYLQYHGHSLQLALSLAYAVFYINGVANYVWAKMLSCLIWRQRSVKLTEITTAQQTIAKKLGQTTAFTHFDPWWQWLWYWPQLLFNLPAWWPRFLATYQLSVAEPHPALLRRAADIIQHGNATWNKTMADILRDPQQASPYEKIAFLRKCADSSSNEPAFLQTCARTQEAAARWDKLYQAIT